MKTSQTRENESDEGGGGNSGEQHHQIRNGEEGKFIFLKKKKKKKEKGKRKGIFFLCFYYIGHTRKLCFPIYYSRSPNEQSDMEENLPHPALERVSLCPPGIENRAGCWKEYIK